MIESGVFSDVVEASKKVDDTLSKTLIDEIFRFHKTAGRCQESAVSGGVTVAQLKRLLDEIPTGTHGQIAKFIRFFKPWCFIAGWWDTNIMAWDVRDEWRENMGIARLNPILKNSESSTQVIFRKLGKQDVNNYPPQGYRYATPEEASQKEVSEEGWLYALVFSEQGWFLGGGAVVDTYAEDLFRGGFVQNYNLKVPHIQAYVALVKL